MKVNEKAFLLTFPVVNSIITRHVYPIEIQIGKYKN